MATHKRNAEIFVFTSFQGGCGKSSIAHRFAKAYRSVSGKVGAFLEMNLFSPSAIVGNMGLRDKLKNSFLDYFTSNWAGFSVDDVNNTFTDQDGIFLIPFTGIRSTEGLRPRFSFSETEAVPALERLLNTFIRKNMFVVIDLPLSFSPMPTYILDRGDALFYIFSSEPSASNFAQQFLKEGEIRKDWMTKLVFLRNMTDGVSEQETCTPFANEMCLPVGSTSVGDGKDEDLNKAILGLAEKAFVMPACDEVKFVREVLDTPQMERLREYQKSLRSEVVTNLDKRFGLTDQELKRKVEQHIEQGFARFPPPVISGVDVKYETRRYLMDEILGLGPLEDLMRDPEVDEIMVNGPNKIYVEKCGKLSLTGKFFNNADHVRAVIDRILMPVGRTVNERTPYVDARLSDGSRVHAIIPPLSLTGPMLTIRRFSREPYTMDDLVCRFKTLSPQVAEFLKLCVKLKKNIIVSGGASSGKTTLLNVLSTFIDPRERVIVIEDSAELKLNQENLGRLEARQQNTEAKTQVTIRDLVRNALRMRPDRIIVGECRADETLDMLQAMNTGHDGSLTTIHANSTRDALARLETLVLMAGVDLPLRAIREQIASSVNIVVQIGRYSDGSRRLLEVAEVAGIEDTTIKVQSIFKFEKKWITEDGHVFGEVVSTGAVPQFLKSIPGNLEESTRHLFTNK